MEKVRLWSAPPVLLGSMLLAVCGTVQAQSADSATVRLLLDRAQALATHGHGNIAVQTWQQVLLSDPTNREALSGIARTDKQLGHMDEARAYLERLRSIGAGSEAAAIQAAPTPQSRASLIATAGRMASEQDYAGAFRVYQQLYGNNPPSGDMALAYYETEAAIPEKREEALRGLRALAAHFPAEARYATALGRVLTYNPKTRAEGLALLHKQDTPDARAAIAQAESWSAPQPGSAAQALAADAAEARARAANSPVAAAYRALNAGHTVQAEQVFNSLLAASPHDPQGLAGLGYVRMKERRFADAAELLKRAHAGGASGKGLEDAIALANFWSTMQQAAAAQSSGDLASALAGYRAALALHPKSPEATEGVAGVLLQQGDAAQAADVYRQVVELDVTRAEAWRGLMQAQVAARDFAGASATASRVPAELAAKLDGDPAYLGARLRGAIASHDADTVAQLREKVLALPFPNGGRGLTSAQKLEYADLLSLAGRAEAASSLYTQVLQTEPESLDAWKALLAADHQAGHDQAAAEVLDSMPVAVNNKGRSDADFLALAAAIQSNVGEVARAQDDLKRALALQSPNSSQLALQLASLDESRGDYAHAYQLFSAELERHPESRAAWTGALECLQSANRTHEAIARLSEMPAEVRASLDSDPVFLGVVASLEAEAGDLRKASATFARMERLYRVANTPVPVGAQLQEAWVLERSGQDAALYPVVSSLGQSPDLTPAQQASFRSLVATWTVRRAMAVLRTGDRTRAIMMLAAAHSTFPTDTNVSISLAGAYVQAGEPKLALALYSMLRPEDATLPEIQGAAGAALAASDSTRAEIWLEVGLRRFEQDATLLRMAAEYEQAHGDVRKAEAYYRAALQAMGNSSGTSMPGVSGGESAPAERLMQLLNPAQTTAAASAPFDNVATPAGRNSGNTDAAGETLGSYDSLSPASPLAAIGSSAAPVDAAQAPALQGGTLAQLSPYGDADVEPSGVPFRAQPPATQSDAFAAPADVDTVPAHPAAEAVDADAVPVQFAPSDVPQSTRLRYVSAAQEDAARLQGAVRQMGTPSTSSDAPANTATDRAGDNAGDSAPLYAPPFISHASSQMQSASSSQGVPSEEMAGEGPAVTVLPPLTGSGNTAAITQPRTPRERVEQQLALIQSGSSPWLGGATSIGVRSGQAGYDRLAVYSGQTETSTMLGPDARLTTIVEPVLLDAGTATAVSTTYQQGTSSSTTVPEVQSAAGVGGEVQLRTPNFAAGVGYTPSGFLVSNITGDLLIHPATGHFTLSFARQPIRDTQLSWAGLRDIGSRSATYPGNVWGGVISNAGELQIASGDAQGGWYIQGGGQYITGDHVLTNQRVDGDAGAYWRVWQDPGKTTVTVGANFFGMHYAHNLRYFTYGQGGYFSPSAYMLGNVPLNVTGRYGLRTHYSVIASLGLQAFSESSTPYYPLDSALEASNNNPYYAEQTNVGANYDLQSKVSYALNEHWFAGAFLNANNSRDYTGTQIGFLIRYMFHPQPMSAEAGPTGLFPTSGLRPLRVP